MKNLILISLFLFLISCTGEKSDSFFTPEKALRYFKSVEDICNRDDGTLWGKNLYGPMMFIDRTSRRIIANQPDNDGILKEKDGIYTGLYPKELIVSNTPVQFGSTLFAMTPLPNVEDEYRIKTQAVHSLFHRFQKESGTFTAGYNTNNMDEKEARLWIKLEWKALRKALNSSGEERQLAVRDALIFKGANRELYQKYANDEKQN